MDKKPIFQRLMRWSIEKMEASVQRTARNLEEGLELLEEAKESYKRQFGEDI